jgi:hypothetical protein
MLDADQAQDCIYSALLSAPQFTRVNVVNERKFISDSQTEFDAIWQTVRNGGSGNGLFVRELTARCINTTNPAPLYEITFPIDCFQNGDAALLPVNPNDPAQLGGGGFMAAALGFAVLDFFYQWNAGLGPMLLEGEVLKTNPDYTGINCVRVTPKIRYAGRAVMPRCTPVQASIAGNVITLACATPGAQIYFTINGSFPTSPLAQNVLAPNPDGTFPPINPASQTYLAPFPGASGLVVRAVAYAPGFNPSALLEFTVTT